MKKLISMALATVMAMSLACTAFATSALTRTTAVAGKYNAPTINVTIPTSGNVVLNPYKLTYTVKPAVVADPTNNIEASAAVTANDYICFDEQQIKNASNVAVEISAVVTGKPTNITLEKGSVKKVGSDGTPTTEDAKTTKSAYMYVQFANAEVDDDGVVTAEYNATPAFTATTGQDGSVTPADSILIQSTASKNTPVLTLEAGTETTTTPADGGEAVTTVTPTIGVFKITGDIVSKPATAYDAKDKVDVTIAWTITPLMVEE